MSITFQARLSAASKTSWTGEIIPIRLKYEPYEVEVSARGSYFHLLVGHHAYGNFICYPNLNKIQTFCRRLRFSE